uniref:Uncharacterized protein n=1 Tax=Acrobeloides nanus TaxID=290746 RepID=A0A914CW89_9BILA
MVWMCQKYLQYDKTVDLDLKFEKASFPAVTLCNLNPYKASAIAQDPMTSNTMNAFVSKVGPPVIPGPTKTSPKKSASNKDSQKKTRRYYQVYSKCFCEGNSSPGGSGLVPNQSCFPGYLGQVEVSLKNENDTKKMRASKCLCQFDFVAKSLWPCFPAGIWKEHICNECIPELGHCPMRFVDDYNSENNDTKISPCKCNDDYNHCIANNDLEDNVPEVFSSDDLSNLFVPDETTP